MERLKKLRKSFKKMLRAEAPADYSWLRQDQKSARLFLKDYHMNILLKDKKFCDGVKQEDWVKTMLLVSFKVDEIVLKNLRAILDVKIKQLKTLCLVGIQEESQMKHGVLTELLKALKRSRMLEMLEIDSFIGKQQVIILPKSVTQLRIIKSSLHRRSYINFVRLELLRMIKISTNMSFKTEIAALKAIKSLRSHGRHFDCWIEVSDKGLFSVFGDENFLEGDVKTLISFETPGFLMRNMTIVCNNDDNKYTKRLMKPDVCCNVAIVKHVFSEYLRTQELASLHLVLETVDTSHRTRSTFEFTRFKMDLKDIWSMLPYLE